MTTLKPVARVASAWTALLRFFQTETAGGALLISTGVIALIWANSPAVGVYHEALETHLGPLDAHIWINDGLMALFFLLVGLELRREMTVGELASPSRLAAPAIAAIGGMIVPALIFTAFNYHDSAHMRGWAVPVATDIAFALAVLSVLGDRVPVSLKVFLTALAIIDDLGAIVVIALFYSSALDLTMVGSAAALLLIMWGASRAGIRTLWPYLVGGAILWVLVFRSGLHATMAGVALAFVIPAGDEDSPATRLEHALQPWVAFLILPLFGLANAGLSFDTLPPGAWRDTLALGTVAGLVIGKQVGVFGAVMLAARLKLARLPSGVTRSQLYGGAILCGIGFTMSLFIGDLAFRNSPRGDEVKLAVFAGSIISAILGLFMLSIATRPSSGEVSESVPHR